MVSVLRTVGRGKKKRRLGKVRMVRPEEYAAIDLDSKVELIRSLLPLGLMHVEEVLDQEVTALAGERYVRKEASISGRRHGSNPGTVGLAGQRVPIRVPRVRSVDGSEIPLRSYDALSGHHEANDQLLKRVLYGISCRNYEAAAEAVPGAIGLSSSTVSRKFVEASAAKLRELQERDLSSEDVVAVFLDGKMFADSTMVVAMGITIHGDKRFLGFVETDTENEKVLTPFLRLLLERGLDISQGLLVIIDGAKGLRAAVRNAFSKRAVAQRCQWHKRENVLGYLSKGEQPIYRKRLQHAYARPEYKEARSALEKLQAELEDRNQSAATSLAEGLEETLTLHRLGLYGVLLLTEDHQLPGIGKRAGRRTMRQGRPLEEFQPAAAVVGDRPHRHRTATAKGQGISPPPATTQGTQEGDRTERQNFTQPKTRGCVIVNEPWRFSTRNRIDSYEIAPATSPSGD